MQGSFCRVNSLHVQWMCFIPVLWLPEKFAKLFNVDLPISILIKPRELFPIGQKCDICKIANPNKFMNILLHFSRLFYLIWFLIWTLIPVCCNIYNSVIFLLCIFSKVAKLEVAFILLLHVVGVEQVLLEHHLKGRALPSLSSQCPSPTSLHL